MAVPNGQAYPRKLMRIVNAAGNETCADCGIKGPDWASVNLGILLCIDCVGCHRAMGTHISKVKSLSLDEWKAEHIESVAEKGNTASNASYEVIVPTMYFRPSPSLPPTYREQFVRAKYERHEFKDSAESQAAREQALSCRRKGMLLKRGKDNNKWPERWCVLDDNSFSYYVSKSDDKPKNIIPLTDCFLDLWPTGLEQQLCFAIIHSGRVYFFSATSPRELWDWALSFRAAQAAAMGFDPLSVDPLPEKIKLRIEPPLMRGALSKQGPKEKGWKRRWVVLYGRILVYFESPTQSVALGGCVLGTQDEGFYAERNFAKCQNGCCVTLCTPNRTYYFKSDVEKEALEWLKTFQAAIEQKPVVRPSLSIQ